MPDSILARYGAEIVGEKAGVINVILARGSADAARRDFSFASGRTNWNFIEPERTGSVRPGAPASGMNAASDEVGQVAPLQSVPEPASDSLFTLSIGSTISVVDEIIGRAVEIGASDVHIEPFANEVIVRLRIDGVLHLGCTLPLGQKDAVVSRIKIMAALDIAEKRRPQDGRIRIESSGVPVDLRVSTLPTSYGEKVVLRILDRRVTAHDLDELGLPPRELKTLRRELQRPHGMILVTGPTGSGKTTTLYAALRHLNTGERNILTIEDPVEYRLEGVNQTLVRSDIGFTFAAGLRAFLRQDPDVIMVGEIRDSETAEIAVRAALTGHVVLSTLHTNDAASTIGRLLDMGVEPFLIAGSVRMIVAQRLLRRVCASCQYASNLDESLRSELELDSDTCIRGRGCAHCRGTGFRGRVAVFEQLEVSAGIYDLIVRRAPVAQLHQQAVNGGMTSLSAAVRDLVISGCTTPEEALRATM